MKPWKTSWALCAALVFCASVAVAQDQKQDESPIDPNAPLQPLDTTPNGGTSGGYPNRPPVAAARGVDTVYDPSPNDPALVTPDQNTLAGAAPFTLGSLQRTVNVFDPVISVSGVGQVVPGTTGKTTVTGNSVASGSLNFNRTWSEYRFTTLYNGGETFNLGYGSATEFFGVTSPHYQFHNLTISQQADWARWHVLIRDDFNASPGATFSGQGIGGPGLASQFTSLLGGSLTSFAQSFLPSENINTGEAMRYRDSVLGQAQYSFSRRAEVTFAASYGLLHFTVPGFQNSEMLDVQAGYDYLLDPWDSIAILASYGKIDYTGTGKYTTDYVGALAYGRKVTGRLAFQAAVGPQEIQMTVPGGGVGNFHLWFVSANSSLTYKRRRGGVAFSFVRGLTGGSGLFLGATSDTATASGQYQLSRHWSGSINGGYSLNYSLVPAGGTSVQFNNWFAGANLGRQIGSHVAINFNYGALEQNNPTGCTVATCGGTGLQQSVGMSLNWHLLPVGKEGR
jgi:hypothetical protein